MAREILILDFEEGKQKALFLFPIPTPRIVTQGDGRDEPVIPTPISTLPEYVQALLTSKERAGINQGTLGAKLFALPLRGRVSEEERDERVRVVYEEQRGDFGRWYEKTYRWMGVRVDAEG